MLAATAAFTAVRSGAVSAGSKPALPRKTTTPCVAVTADTTKFETELEQTERILREHIRKCRVVRFDREVSLDGPLKVRAVYETSNERGPWDDEVARLTKNGRIQCCSVSVVSDEIDVAMLGAIRKFRIDEPKYEIDVTWFVPSL